LACEIEVQLGNLDVARGYVNQIRTRAANPVGFVKNPDGSNAANYVIGTYDSPWTDPVMAQKAVQFEQRLEFGMEGHRRFDLVRWAIADQTLNAYYLVEGNQTQLSERGSVCKRETRIFPDSHPGDTQQSERWPKDADTKSMNLGKSS